MSSARIGDRVAYQKIGRGHKMLRGNGVVVKIWRRYGFVGWNVKDDETGEVVSAIPSYGILEILGKAERKSNHMEQSKHHEQEDPRLRAELQSFANLSKALRKADERS